MTDLPTVLEVAFRKVISLIRRVKTSLGSGVGADAPGAQPTRGLSASAQTSKENQKSNFFHCPDDVGHAVVRPQGRPDE